MRLKSRNWNPSLVNISVLEVLWVQHSVRCAGYDRDPSAMEVDPAGKIRAYVHKNAYTQTHMQKYRTH